MKIDDIIDVIKSEGINVYNAFITLKNGVQQASDTMYFFGLDENEPFGSIVVIDNTFLIRIAYHKGKEKLFETYYYDQTKFKKHLYALADAYHYNKKVEKLQKISKLYNKTFK